MKHDPFGNLREWGNVLDTFKRQADCGELSDCQDGLIRILRYKGNWRLREEVLNRVGEVQAPSAELVYQVLAVLDDDNIYYDARILAGNALIQLVNKLQPAKYHDVYSQVQKIVRNLKSTPQPPIFETALNRIHSEINSRH
jgi:hypothetical protein